MSLKGLQGSDLVVTNLVRERLSEAGFDASGAALDIRTTAGNVVLRGEVSSPGERAEIERIARLVTGVSGVDNRLTTKNSIFADAGSVP